MKHVLEGLKMKCHHEGGLLHQKHFDEWITISKDLSNHQTINKEELHEFHRGRLINIVIFLFKINLAVLQ